MALRARGCGLVIGASWELWGGLGWGLGLRGGRRRGLGFAFASGEGGEGGVLGHCAHPD